MMESTERNLLVTEHLPFIKLLASQYSGQDRYQDLVQEGVLGLLRACDTFDESRGVKFLTYAAWWIRAFMSTYVKRANKYIPVEDAEMEHITSHAVPQTNMEDMIIMEDIKEKMHKELHDTGARGRDIDIVLSRYLTDSPETLQELGDRYGISRERARQIEERMLTKIKEKIL